MNKRGVSPVVASVLLIALTFVLAAIVFLWARGFLAEKTQKFGEPVESSCERISFEAEAIINDGISIVNRGNVPLYGVEIRKKGFGSLRNVGVFDKTIGIGENGKIGMPGGVSAGDTIVLVPMVLGEVSGAKKSFTCGVFTGQETEVK